MGLIKQILIKNIPLNLYLAMKRWNYKRLHKSEFLRSQYLRENVSTEGYSYQGFEEKKAIFVHIPKCAGVSVNKVLFRNLDGGHRTLEEYSIIFEPEKFNNYFKFTFVRNPWDRVVSAFFFLKKGGYNEKDKAWAEKELKEYIDFDSFVKNWINEENIWKVHHFRPQYHYILDSKNKISLDFIGYFENICNDFYTISKTLGLNVKISESNASRHKNYMEYYTEETMKIIADVYAKDVKLLGYSFDNTNLKDQLNKRLISTENIN